MQRPIMINDAVHEKLMDLKKRIEEKVGEDVSFNAFLLMMLNEMERLDEAVAERTREHVGQPMSSPVIGEHIPAIWPAVFPPVNEPTWSPPVWYQQMMTDSSAGSGTTYGVLTVPTTGAKCKTCGHSSVVDGVCAYCGRRVL